MHVRDTSLGTFSTDQLVLLLFSPIVFLHWEGSQQALQEIQGTPGTQDLDINCLHVSTKRKIEACGSRENQYMSYFLPTFKYCPFTDILFRPMLWDAL